MIRARVWVGDVDSPVLLCPTSTQARWYENVQLACVCMRVSGASAARTWGLDVNRLGDI